jgi:hypothetical protein
MVHVKQWVVTPCSLVGEQQFLRNMVPPFQVHNFPLSIRIRFYRIDLQTHNVWLFVAREFETEEFSRMLIPALSRKRCLT